MRVDASPNTVQFAMLSRTTGQVQKLQTSSSASPSAVRNYDGDQFVIQSRAEVRAAQHAEKSAQFQQASAQHPPQASLNGLENGRRFQPDFAKTAVETHKATAAILNDVTDTPKAKLSAPKSPLEPQTASTSGTTNASGVFGQDQLDAVNSLFGTQTGDRGFETSVDYNNDGSIDFSDITYILSKWGEALPADQQVIPQPDLGGPFGQNHLDAVNEFFGKSFGDDGFLAQADANGDGTINFSDITHILSNWGKPTGAGTA